MAIEDYAGQHITVQQKLALETAKITWTEIQRFFAQGLIIVVHPDLDLIEIAAKFHNDESDDIRELLDGVKIRKAETVDAKTWNRFDTLFWAVVTAPWVLVQEIPENSN